MKGKLRLGGNEVIFPKLQGRLTARKYTGRPRGQGIQCQVWSRPNSSQSDAHTLEITSTEEKDTLIPIAGVRKALVS